MWRIILLISSLSLIVKNHSVFSQQAAFHMAGYLKSLQSATIPGSGDTLFSSSLIHNRINFKLDYNSNLTLRLEIRNRIFYGDQLRQVSDFGSLISQNDEYWKLSTLWLNNKSIVIHSIIDRMQLQYFDDAVDIRIGRQRINWGIHNFWNPNDLFNTYNFLDFDFEERPGSDALRMQFYLKNGSSFEAAFKPGKSSDSHTAGFLYKFNRSGYDFQFLGGLLKKDLVIGGGWAGGINQTGWKGEFSYFIPYGKQNENRNVLVLTTMLDQTFSESWYVSLSALFQSSFTEFNQMPNEYSILSLSAKNLFPSKISLLSSVTKSFSSILSLNLSCLYATNRNVFILFPDISWNVSESLQIDLTDQSYFSKIVSSYGSLAHTLYLRGKWSF